MIDLRQNLCAKGSGIDAERLMHPHSLVIDPIISHVGFRLPACPELVVRHHGINAPAGCGSIGAEMKKTGAAQVTERS